MSGYKSAIVALSFRSVLLCRWKLNMQASSIQFLLNNEAVILDNVDPNMTVLQYLREVRLSSGTKEGCASGDCGACTVVLAELSANNANELTYKSINSCITFVGSLHGKQIISVEHLKQDKNLHHVQQAIVDNHASQCGFCTPGFVMSTFALHKTNDSPTREEAIKALAGNLCRCTGYRSIIDAAMTPSSQMLDDSFAKNYSQTINQLTKIQKAENVELLGSKKQYFAPKNVSELSRKILKKPQATLVAGGTDLALSVTQNLVSIEELVYLGDVFELNQIDEDENEMIIGSAVPYTQFSPVLEKEYPELGEMIERIGSKQIRNTGTLGGNIGNASPIGDMPPALIALGAEMTLQCGEQQRKVLVEDYFVGYKKTILAESEFIREIFIPKSKETQLLKLYKISKRFDDDISAVLAAIFIEIDSGKVKTIRIAFGGMAEIPKRAKNCELALLSKTFNQENITLAQQALSKDFKPMTDVRASEEYRMKVAQNLIQKCYLELTQKNIETRVINYA